MRAVVLRGTCDIAVEEVPDPDFEAAGDAIVAITSSALCGSDLHMIEGRIGPDTGLRLGHEPLGVVTRVGSGVSRVRPGQRVVAPTHIFCGTCDMCARGYSAACLRVNPDRAGAAYGYAGMGGYPGAHAEYLRVPFADANLVTLHAAALRRRRRPRGGGPKAIAIVTATARCATVPPGSA